jgi:hypothetical protein
VCGYSNLEGRSHVRRGLDSELRADETGILARDRKTESGANSFTPVARGVAPPEPFEDPLHLTIRDPGSAVGDGDPCFAVCLGELDADVPAFAMDNGVFEKVADDALEPRLVRVHDEMLRADDSHGRVRRSAAGDLTREVDQIDVLAFDMGTTGFGASQLEKVVDQTLECPYLAGGQPDG